MFHLKERYTPGLGGTGPTHPGSSQYTDLPFTTPFWQELFRRPCPFQMVSTLEANTKTKLSPGLGQCPVQDGPAGKVTCGGCASHLWVAPGETREAPGSPGRTWLCPHLKHTPRASLTPSHSPGPPHQSVNRSFFLPQPSTARASGGPEGETLSLLSRNL